MNDPDVFMELARTDAMFTVYSMCLERQTDALLLFSWHLNRSDKNRSPPSVRRHGSHRGRACAAKRIRGVDKEASRQADTHQLRRLFGSTESQFQKINTDYKGCCVFNSPHIWAFATLSIFLSLSAPILLFFDLTLSLWEHPPTCFASSSFQD